MRKYKPILNKEIYMNSIADGSVIIQTSSESVPSTPPWFGEVALLARHLRQQGVLSAIGERVRFARRRFGHYDVIDFVAVLFGYAISGERTLEAFYERLPPFAPSFMALFGRDRLPARSTLSRFLAALTSEPVEVLRSLFLEDLLARQLCKEEQQCGLTDRMGNQWRVFDIDGTREAARQRALPQTSDRPAEVRRMLELCAPGYTGRKRGEVVRTRTTVLQAHTHQWLASFGNPGNGQYREELRRAVAVIQAYVQAHDFAEQRALLRLDGQYGTLAVVADLSGLWYVMRGKDYQLLDRPEIQARLHLPPDQQFSRPESGLVRTLYDCPDLPLLPQGKPCRILIATHPASEKKSRVGVTRAGIVYELFLTNLPQTAFTTSDVVALYLHRGAFETTLADEDAEQDPDRWCSHSPCGQETWQIISQWVWNLRLELGHQLEPEPPRTTEFAPAAQLPVREEAARTPTPACGYGSAQGALPWKAGRFSGQDFAPQPDGTLRCPAGASLFPQERRRETDGSLRIVYEARIGACRPCRLREQCQWHGKAAKHPRRVSLLLHPLDVGSAPLLWQDWSRRQHRRACIQLLRCQRVDVPMQVPAPVLEASTPTILSRAQRAHYRLSWEERLTRNARAPTVAQPTLMLYGVPDAFATFLGLSMA
jgi:hypothetical protein